LLALLVLDLDGFKLVNDEHGHLAGDGLLVEMTKRIRTCLQPTDTVSRFAGDEFTILVRGITDMKQPVGLSKRLLALIAKPMLIDGVDVCLSASVGLAMYPFNADSPKALLRVADQAMYSAKKLGGNQLYVYSNG